MTAQRALPRFRCWPLLLIAAPAAVAVWSGWVGLGGMCGFGLVAPLPGIWGSLRINTAITLPVGVESYGAYALYAWLASGASAKTLTFARRSAIGALVLGMTGQVAYHLLAAYGHSRAPAIVVVLVACLPVVTLSFAAALVHLMHADTVAARQARAEKAEREVARQAAAAAKAPRKPVAASARKKTAVKRTSDPGSSVRNKPPASAPEVLASSAPAPALSSAPEPDGADDLSTEAQALAIRAAEPAISGSELGRRLGKSDRYGRDLIKKLDSTETAVN